MTYNNNADCNGDGSCNNNEDSATAGAEAAQAQVHAHANQGEDEIQEEQVLTQPNSQDNGAASGGSLVVEYDLFSKSMTFYMTFVLCSLTLV